MTAMRILHLDSGRELRGGQWQVLFLLEGLRARGFELRVLARRHSALLREATERGFDVAPLTPLSLRRAAAWADLIHAHDARSHTLAAVLAAGKLVVSRRVAFPLQRNLLSSWKYRRAERLVCVSEAVRQSLLEAGVDGRRTVVVYDGVPELPSSTHDGEIVALESADPAKGSKLVSEAASLAGVPVRLSHDLTTDLASARLLVYLSRQEGLGSAALLAQSAGVPVLASRVGGLPEAVEDGVTGVLTANDPHEVSEHLRELAAGRERCRRMGLAGAERVRRLFSLDRMVDSTACVYREVAG